ncbi:MAG: maleylpyruvate isomerase family mycothiol-dependent enzyme [Chloroflexi bacterium]|nr:maleylpyruvate isomerase family mycothiol-dependent enzyme [Chloroflexota bacterium]
MTTTSSKLFNAADINTVTNDEAYDLMKTALDRLIALVEILETDDWNKPTACVEWTIRDMIAHQAGGFASGTGYGEMFRQALRLPKPGQLIEDAINAFQLKERADKLPEELIEELRHAGPIATQKWAYEFRFAKLLAMPHPIAGTLSLRYLMHVTHSRDTWMHRLDICRATGREFEQTREHDSRIAELVMLDVANLLAKKKDSPTLIFKLTGIAGGKWKVGKGEPIATIEMDVLDFNIFVSGRYSYEEAFPLMTITGDAKSAEGVLKDILILY